MFNFQKSYIIDKIQIYYNGISLDLKEIDTCMLINIKSIKLEHTFTLYYDKDTFIKIANNNIDEIVCDIIKELKIKISKYVLDLNYIEGE